jgi:transcriptional regulator with GAF, ATPase, and Fis domain
MVVESMSGIIGGQAYQFYIEKVQGEIVEINLLLLLSLSVILIIFTTIITLAIKGTVSERRKTRAERSYRLLSEMISRTQGFCADISEESLAILIDQFFIILIDKFSYEHIYGGGVLLPDKNDENYLTFIRMSSHRKLSEKRFYIGAQFDKTKERGIAGSVFVSGEAEICNYRNPAAGEADNQFFYEFKNLIGRGEVTPYSSFVCLPIRWDNNIIGVLSIESTEFNAFDEDLVTWFQPIADQLGFAFYVYNCQ